MVTCHGPWSRRSWLAIVIMLLKGVSPRRCRYRAGRAASLRDLDGSDMTSVTQNSPDQDPPGAWRGMRRVAQKALAPVERFPRDRGGQWHSPSPVGGGCAGVGELAVAFELRGALASAARIRSRPVVVPARPPVLDRRRAHDDLLLRRRARDPARDPSRPPSTVGSPSGSCPCSRWRTPASTWAACR